MLHVLVAMKTAVVVVDNVIVVTTDAADANGSGFGGYACSGDGLVGDGPQSSTSGGDGADGGCSGGCGGD